MAIRARQSLSARERAGLSATDRGARVSTDRVVICTNGYADELWPGVRRSVIAPNSLSDRDRAFVRQHPKIHPPFWSSLLGRTQAATLLPARRSRTAAARRARAVSRAARSLRLGASRSNASTTLPTSRGCGDRALRWCGRVTITRDFLPHLHEPAPGLLIDIGCMGRGVGLQTALGQAMADYLASGDQAALPLPLTPIKPLPFHGLHKAYVAAIIAWYRMTDGGVKA